MIKTTAFRIFFTCLYPCAGLVLFFIWNDGPPSPLWFQVAASLFIIGFAAALTWFSLMLVEISHKIAKGI